MADDTKVIIGIDLILRNLQRTLQGLSQVEKQLSRLGGIKLGQQGFDKAVIAATKLQLQQGKLAVQAQQLANAQERQRQVSDRLALSQLKLEQAFDRAAKAEQRSNVQSVKSTQSAADQVRRINEQTARQAAQQEALRARAAKTVADVQVKEAQRGADALADGLQRSQQQARQFAQGLETVGNSLRSIGQGLTSVGFTLTAVLTAPLIALGRAGLDASVTLDSLKLGLAAITGSAEEAGRQLQRLTQIAKLPGIGFEEAIQGSIRLQAVGFSAEQAEKALIQFSNAIALTGGGRAELERVTVQLGQLAAKGKVLSQDLRPIIEAAPAVGTALKQAFGTVNADDIAALTKNSEEFLSTLTKQLEQLPRAAGGARNAFENFKDSIFLASTAIGDALLPVLTKLANIALPIIETLAEGFRKLPFPIQAIIVVIGGVVAAFGPVLIIVGQLTVGIGRLTVGLAQLKLQAGEAATSTEALAIAMAEARAATAGFATGLRSLAGPIGVALAILAILIPEFIKLAESEEKVAEVNADAAKATNERVKSLRSEVQFLEGLGDAVNRTALEQERLNKSYQSLSASAKTRIDFIDDENEKLAELIRLKQEQLKLDAFAQQSNTATLARNTAMALNAQAKAEADFAKAKADFTNAELSANAELIRSRGGALTATDRLLRIQQIQNDAAARGKKATNDLASAERDSVEAVRKLIEVTGLSGDALIAQVRAAGADEAAIRKLQKAVEDLAAAQKQAATEIVEATDATLKSLRKLRDDLKNDPLIETAKTGKEALDSILDLIRETTTNTEDAARALQNYIDLVPGLKQAVERAGGIKEAVKDLFKLPKSDSGTSLRNAQERLQQQLTDVALAAKDKQLAEEQAANDESLRRNELAFRLQLASYRRYLENRAELTNDAIDKEIARQQEVVAAARLTQARLLKEAQRPGLPETERVNRQVQAARADEVAIKAETKIVELESKRTETTNDLRIALGELAKQQEADVRQLEIEFAQLQGRIESAFKAEIVERFRVRLGELGRDQVDINEQLTSKTSKLTAEERERLKAIQAQNQAEIDQINFIQQTSDALAVLKTAEQFIADAKDKQRLLEEQISNDVELRGQTEQQAIQRRLLGEEQVKQKLLLSRDIVQDEIDRLQTLGLDVPRELSNFIDQINVQVQSLGKLSFREQFRLASEEFDRLNNTRIEKIADVERAVKRRTISEVEGVVQIREINRDYLGDLQTQLDLLQQIAEASHNEDLLQQVRQLRGELADANTELESFGKQLRSVSIDALQSGLSDFFASVGDRTKTAKEKLMDFFDSVLARINSFIGEQLSRKLIESIFGTPDQQSKGAGGLVNAAKRIFGIGGGTVQGEADVHSIASAGGIGQATAQASATAFATTVTASAAGFSTSVITAGAAFATSIVAAGAAFVAALAAGSAAQVVGGAGNQLSSLLGAATGMFPAVPGGLVRVVEGGFPEAVLTTDPQHAARQVSILRQFLRETRGLFGRIPGFDAGGFISAGDVALGMLGSISRSGSPTPPESALSGPSRQRNLRFIFVDDQRDVRNWMDSAEGDLVFVEKLHRNRHTLRRLT